MWLTKKGRAEENDTKEWDAFYQRFEDRFRGDSDQIFSKLQQRYGGKLSALASGTAKGLRNFLDLGCGRGELLGLASQCGFRSKGVDLNEVAISRCREQGFEVDHKDLLQALKEIPTESLSAIASLHVIEHVPAPYFWQVYKEAFRALASGGVFFVETPSLYSLWTSGRQFYLDPTHTKPVHPEFVRFMAEDVGFREVELLGFDPVECIERPQLKSLCSQNSCIDLQKLEDWLFGAMDTCIWARKL